MADSGRLERSLRSFNTSRFFKTTNPFGDIDIPAPYSLIFSDFSKITHGILFLCRIIPNARPEMPAPTIAI